MCSIVEPLVFPNVISRLKKMVSGWHQEWRRFDTFLLGSKAHDAPMRFASTFLPYLSAVPVRAATHFIPPAPSPRYISATKFWIARVVRRDVNVMSNVPAAEQRHDVGRDCNSRSDAIGHTSMIFEVNYGLEHKRDRHSFL